MAVAVAQQIGASLGQSLGPSHSMGMVLVSQPARKSWQ
jgi:hypothetical protein